MRNTLFGCWRWPSAVQPWYHLQQRARPIFTERAVVTIPKISIPTQFMWSNGIVTMSMFTSAFDGTLLCQGEGGRGVGRELTLHPPKPSFRLAKPHQYHGWLLWSALSKSPFTIAFFATSRNFQSLLIIPSSSHFNRPWFFMTPIFCEVQSRYIVDSATFSLHTFSAIQVSLPVQLYPSPVNPGLQVQLNDPSVLLHKAPSLLQLWVSWAHSSISERELTDIDHSRGVH